ncbi:MAG: Na+/H+ antiporter NhaA [Actinobacteria bacterium]|nr:Na+/H+ antiporter NhaA [Actinomycetota bacterium]
MKTRSPRARSPLSRMVSPLRDFLHTEAAGGILLVLASVAALVWANSPWKASYHRLWESTISITVAGHSLSLDLQHWVNDGLMTIFFLVVGLEIKRELTTGHLAGRRAATLPVAAAVGGMVVPAVLYLAIAGGTAPKGWGVPMATDIALAVGVLALAGKGAPASLRAFLLGLAVVDDIGAIVVIAVFYSTGVLFGWLVAAAVGVLLTVVFQRLGVYQTLVYVVIGTFVWFALHEAGVHPTLAGVAMGLLAPVTPRVDPELIDAEELADLSTVEHARATQSMARSTVSTVEWLEHVLHPWTSFIIVPVFALANAGVEVSTESLRDAVKSPIMWGIIVGLVVGKPLGVMLVSKLAVRSGRADSPEGTTSRHLLGAGNAAGIGFSVALFIAELAFTNDDGTPNEAHITDAKMAILLASLVSGLLAWGVLRQRREPTKLS